MPLASPLWSSFSIIFHLFSARNALLIQILPVGLRLSAPEIFSTALAPIPSPSLDFLSAYILTLHQSVGHLVLNKGVPHLSCCHKILLLHYPLPAPTKSGLLEGLWDPVEWVQPLLRKELKTILPHAHTDTPEKPPRFMRGDGESEQSQRVEAGGSESPPLPR